MAGKAGKVRVSITVRDRDGGYRRLMARSSRLARGPAVEVGVLGAEAAAEHAGGEGLTTAEVAAFHEFGLGVPERSFLRGWFDERKAANTRIISLAGALTLLGHVTPMQGLEGVGLAMVGDIQQRIRAGIEPPLHPLTILAKGSSTPLIDTGQLRSSVTSRVVLA